MNLFLVLFVHPVVSSPVRLTVRPKISGSHVVWWFNGETLNLYDTMVTLTATPPYNGPYAWDFVVGTVRADFLLPRDQSTIDLVSRKRSEIPNDVEVRVTVNGVLSNPFRLTVKSPAELEYVRIEHDPDPDYGYESNVYYNIKDQFKKYLPLRVPLNERWTSAVTADWLGMNWRRGAPAGAIVPAMGWRDRIQGEWVAGSYTPSPRPPQTPLGNTDVYHWDGEWRVGSTIIGDGVKVQTNRWQKYRDHATHTRIVSPIP